LKSRCVMKGRPMRALPSGMQTRLSIDLADF
jgi:hypothetical protein